jgi:hypothetical protein
MVETSPFQKFIYWLKGGVSEKKVENQLNENPHATAIDNTDKRESEIAEDISKMHLLNDKIFSSMPQELREQVYRTSRSFWRIGKEDGSIGQKQIERDYFKACAHDLSDQLLIFMQKESVPFVTKLEGSRVRKEKAEEILKQAEDYRHDINTREQLYPKQFSKSVARLYIVIGILLVLADIPLALMVTEKIFDFERADIFHRIKDLMVIPLGDKCNNLSVHFFKTIASNWQLVIMTMGVALSAIYFKVFYDDFLAYPVDKAIRQDKLLTARNRPPSNSEDIDAFEKTRKDELEKMAQKRLYIQWAKAVILFFTLATIVVLGIVRATTEEEINFGSSLMYILLTILFPLIGGILFSLGMGNFHNRQEKKHAENYFAEKRKEHMDAVEYFSTCEQSVSTYKAFIGKCENNSVADNFEKLFLHCYLHGYQRGVVNPDKDLDMYDRAQKFRDRLFATKSNEALQRINNISYSK